MKKFKNLRYGFSFKQYANYFKYKISKKETNLKYKPIWLLLYLSDLCNLKCAMCPHHSDYDNSFAFQKQLDNKFMDIELIKKIFKKNKEAIFVMLGGVGEPFMHPNFLDIVDLCSKEKKKINIITNGTLLNNENMKHLVKNKMVNQISISLNASNSTDYAAICNVNKNVFGKVVDNISKLIHLKKVMVLKWKLW